MRHLITAAILSGYAITANAGTLDAPADTPTVAPVVPVEDTSSWAGFYGGLSYSGVSGGINENSFNPNMPALESSAAVGAFLGYNWQRDNLVYGAELNFTNVDTGFVGFASSFQQSVTELRGRVGYTPMDDLLVYGFLGYAMTTMDDAGTPYDQTGMSFGLGADYMVWNDMFVGLEVARRDVAGMDPGATGTLGAEIDTIGLRIGYKF